MRHVQRTFLKKKYFQISKFWKDKIYRKRGVARISQGEKLFSTRVSLQSRTSGPLCLPNGKLLSDELKGGSPHRRLKKMERQTVLIFWLAKQARVCHKAIGHTCWGQILLTEKNSRKGHNDQNIARTRYSREERTQTEKGHTFSKKTKNIHEIPTS
jgi:hypothetical protein